ncbi:MAG: SEC-C domain-containing protein, partial [Ilumatobacteraceae bacterium]
RNDPCPCGSGRKYKTCHLGRETHSLEDRAGWLYIKADRFLRDRFPELVDDLAGVIADPLDQPELFDLMVDSTLVPDLVLHEDGVFAEFLAARAGILPPDEAQLGEQWAATDHAVFEVIEIHAHDVELREVTGGDHISVRHIDFGEQIRPTTLVVGRPLPIADHHRAFGGLMPCPPVHLNRLLTALASGSSDEIASVIADIVAPPVLTNTDGHDLVAHRITWAVEDPTVVGEALVAAGLQAAGADRWTLIRLSRELDDVTVATVTLDGDRLTGDVNSAERAEELQRLVTAALPGAGLLDVDARPFELPPGTPVDEIDDPMDEPGPELRAALAEITARFDER